MPSIYTSNASAEDATALALALQIKTLTVPIWPAVEVYMWALKEAFSGRAADVTEENIQARVRGTSSWPSRTSSAGSSSRRGTRARWPWGTRRSTATWRAGSPSSRTSPRRSSTGSAGGSTKRPAGRSSPRVLTKAPTAELKPNQTDQDTLPPYEVLDPILEMYVENDRSVAEIVRTGFDAETVRKVARMVDRSEYKRRQAPPGIKITPAPSAATAACRSRTGLEGRLSDRPRGNHTSGRETSGGIRGVLGLSVREDRGLRDSAAVRQGRPDLSYGEVGDYVCFIESGQVLIYVRKFTVEEEIKTLGPGDCFGEMAVFYKDRRTASARALTDVSLLSVARGSFLNLLKSERALAERINAVLALRNEELILKENVIDATG